MTIGSEHEIPPTRIRAPLLPLGILAIGFVAALYVLVGYPYRARAADQIGSGSGVAVSTAAQAQTPSAPMASPVRSNRAAAAPAPVSAAAPAVAAPSPESLAKLDQAQAQLDAAFHELNQSRETMRQASEVQRRTLLACALFLAVFAIVAVAVVIQVSFQLRSWNKRSLDSLRQVEGIASQLKPLREAQEEVKQTLPRLLQEVGERALSFQEEGARFSPRSLTVLDDIDHLAYLGDARLVFGHFSDPAEVTVYLNGLLLSAVAHLVRSDPWMAFARIDQFLELLGRYPDAVDQHRIAQAYSYRAQAAYQVLDAQDAEPSWLRKSERSQIEALSKQGFEDIGKASRLDPEWHHTMFVEAQLCSRFYVPEEPSETMPRAEISVRGLRRAVSLYKEMIDHRRYSGPARHDLARCLKRIAEQTAEKSDFSDFGYALSAFPTDEELADEALAARQPNSQDRFLWQWMLADPELFRSVEKLNLAEYRSFWVRLLDNKVHLRNWRADLAELQQKNPAMRDWSVQLLHTDSTISLANPISRRPERFEAPSSKT